MKRILVVSSTFPQYAGDTRGQFILRYWEARGQAGARVRFLVPRTAWVDETLSVGPGCEVARFSYAPKPLSTLTGRFGILENIRERHARAGLLFPFMLGMTHALREHVSEFQPELIAAHMVLPCGVVAASVAKRGGIPYEVFGHGSDVDLLLRLPPPLRALCLRELNNATRMYFPSLEKLRRFAAAIDVQAFRPQLAVELMSAGIRPLEASQTLSSPSEPSILYMGRLTKQKGVEDLLAAIALMPEPPTLHIAGDGPERRALERHADDLSVNACFHGFVNENRRDVLYRQSAVLCVPSREIGGFSEGAPLVIAEAKQYGLPVVATRVGGIPELMADIHPASQLVQPQNPRALAHALHCALGALRSH